MQDLRAHLDVLQREGELVSVDVPVDPRLEMTEIASRLVRREGPAVLFRNPVGSRVPVLLNVLGTRRRMELALGRAPAEIAAEIEGFLDDMMPPRPSLAWRHRRLLWRGTKVRVAEARRPACRELTEEPRLSQLPVLTCWPEDGGPFITWPLVVTRRPGTGEGRAGEDNLGLYRMQVFSDAETGMHWQVGKGGGFHHHEAERVGRDLPCAVAIGADPVSMLAGMLPLPEGISELAFAGFLRGSPTRVTRMAGGLPVPAGAEIVLEGVVPAGVRRREGPFGDHFGHYSHAAEFPVFRVHRVHRRRDAIYVAAVVGKPPQEDKVLGEAAQEMFLPLLKMTRPEVRDAWAWYETGFHGLFTVSMRPRYAKESLKTAFSVLGEGQVSLTKACVVVPWEVDCRDVRALLRALRERFDPRRDALVLPNTSADTLDFTGERLNHGSKMILDLTGEPRGRAPLEGLPDLAARHEAIREQALVEDALLLVRLRDGSEARSTVRRLVEDPALEAVPLIVAVSEDVDLGDPVSWLWGWFTRFDPASDVVFRSSTLRGPIAVHEGPMGIDATWKRGYPEPLEMPEEIVKKVDRRWREYGSLP